MNPSFTTLSWDQTTLGEDNSKTIAVVRDWLDTLSAEDRLEAWGGLVPSGYSIRYGDGPEPTTTPLFSVHEDPRPRTPPTNSSPSAVQVPRLAPSTTNEESQITSATPSSNSVPEINTPQVEVFKNFRVSIDDPCYKVLPLALKKYNITADWRQYALYIVFEDQERCLGLHEKPLIIFKLLDREGKAPMFMLRKHPAPVEGHTSIINPGEISRSSSPNNLTQVPEVFI
ncbi:hypothetical protein SLS56_010601 [Neofusicoccum ribis]|uniref:Ras-associating domain-containing protein n=1 Tax=Neofusicoccum ribis TaxID=45134 RepID=A0ABR3SDZ5_9PEZI